MKLKGQHNFKTTPDVLWEKLMDADTLARITPGVSRLESKGDDLFEAIADVKLGPVKGSFKGELSVLDKKEPESFTLNIKQSSKIGNVSAEVHIHIKPVSELETEMSFDGKANLSGLLARTGQRVLSGVANTLTKQFFSAMEEEVASTPT
jgi:carbon monoxide dehydrogenase subunit G